MPVNGKTGELDFGEGNRPRPAANSNLSGTLRTYFPNAWTTRRFNSAFIADFLEALHPCR
jgi:hypothetical protein